MSKKTNIYLNALNKYAFHKSNYFFMTKTYIKNQYL